MKYLLLLFGDESSWADMTEEEAGAELAAYERYGEEATKAGVFVAGARLQGPRRCSRLGGALPRLRERLDRDPPGDGLRGGRLRRVR